MSSEYIHFTGEESAYTQKQVLESELNILTSIKQLQTYKKLRNEEFKIKIALKTKLDEINTELQVLDKTLPLTELKIKNENIPIRIHQEKDEPSSIEDELEVIRQKLARLQ